MCVHQPDREDVPATVFVVFSVQEIDQVSVPYVEAVYLREEDANVRRDDIRATTDKGAYVEEYDLD